jgi:hypothetical protein
LAIHTLVGRAKGYLDSFIDRQRFARGGPSGSSRGFGAHRARKWYFEGFEVGAPGDAATDLWPQFSLEADLYGRWMVRLSEKNTNEHPAWYPVELRRGSSVVAV